MAAAAHLETHTHIQIHAHTHTHHQECRLSKHRNSSERDTMMSEKSCLATLHMSSGQVCYNCREGEHTHAHRPYSYTGIFNKLHISQKHTLTHGNMSHLMNVSHPPGRGMKRRMMGNCDVSNLSAFWPSDLLLCGSCASVNQSKWSTVVINSKNDLQITKDWTFQWVCVCVCLCVGCACLERGH